MSNIELESESEEIAAPDAAAIRQQVEFYFSDANLQRDTFLRGHITRDDEGYVDLKLIASFKKMKALSGGERVALESIADALEGSDVVGLNDDRLRVRRFEPLPTPKQKNKPAFRTVVVMGMPDAMQDPADTTGLEAMFSSVGAIERVLVLGNDEQNDGEFGKKYCRKHPAFRAREPIGIVQYSTQAEACDACEKLDESKTSWRGGMGVLLLEQGAEWKKREREKRAAEKSAREERQAEVLAERDAKKKAQAEAADKGTGGKLQSTLSGLAAAVEAGAKPPAQRKRLQLTKRGAGSGAGAAVAAKRKPDTGGSSTTSNDGKCDESEALLLAKGPSGYGRDRRGFGAHWRKDHPWRGPDGQEQCVFRHILSVDFAASLRHAILCKTDAVM